MPEPSFGEIRTAVYNAACEYLEPHLYELEQQKEEKISKVLNETFPEQRYLRHQNQQDLARISLTASEDEISDVVAKIHFGNVRTGRELMGSIVEDMKKASTIDFTSFMERFGGRLDEIAQPTQANLASYLLFRRSIIDIYREIMKKSKDRFEKEATIHHLIFPMGMEHEDATSFFLITCGCWTNV